MRVQWVEDPDQWPDDTLVSYLFVLKDGQVSGVHLEPHSESGDWAEHWDFLLESDGRVSCAAWYRGTLDQDPLRPSTSLNSP